MQAPFGPLPCWNCEINHIRPFQPKRHNDKFRATYPFPNMIPRKGPSEIRSASGAASSSLTESLDLHIHLERVYHVLVNGLYDEVFAVIANVTLTNEARGVEDPTHAGNSRIGYLVTFRALGHSSAPLRR